MRRASSDSSSSARPSASDSRWRYFGGTAPRPARQARPAPPREALERRPDRRLVEVEDRVAVGRLVAGEPQGVEGQWIRVRRRALLLDEATEDSDLDRVRSMHGQRVSAL